MSRANGAKRLSGRNGRLVRLKSWLFAAGVTQRVVSLRAKIPETRLSCIINGRVRASAEERIALAKVLNASEEVLFR